jgi:signal peptidase I
MFGKNKNPYPRHVQDVDLSFRQQAVLFVWELFKVVVISLVIIIPVRYFLIKPFYVKGASMEPTFHDRQYLIINELSYFLGDPVRGDSVVFRYPLDPSQYFIKRVVGLPGERVVVSDGQVRIYHQGAADGMILQEPYLAQGVVTGGAVDLTLAAEQYFLLGDNRSESLDSRAFGPVQRHSIVGKTLFRGWPLDKVGFVINNLEYNL